MKHGYGLRLKEFIRENSLRNKEIADYLGYTPTAVSEWISEKNRPNIIDLSKLADRYKLNTHWLLTGDGEMLLSENKSSSSSGKLNKIQMILDKQLKEIAATRKTIDDQLELKVVGEIAAGPPVAVENYEPLDVIALDKSYVNDISDFTCFRVNGHSMEPSIHHNDLVIIRNGDNFSDLIGKVVAVRVNGEITLKQLEIDTRNKVIILLSTNHRYPPITIMPEENPDFTLLGELAFLFRRY